MQIKVDRLPKGLMDTAGRCYSQLCRALSFVRDPLAKPVTDFPRIPGDFTPVLQFLVCSDIHNRFDRMRDMFSLARKEIKGTAYEKIDAVLIAGDFTDSGKSEDIAAFYDVLRECCGSETEPVVCLGNHEYHTSGKDVRERYEAITGMKPEVHKVINGIHFLGFSYSDVETFDKALCRRVTQELDAAHADTPAKPVFVIEHPHPRATVYGSINWGQTEILQPLGKYPQVISFSGHSHYPVRDPRSAYQGRFTAFGTGGLKYYELEMNLNAGFFPQEEESQGNFYLVGVDKNGAVALRAYDTVGGGRYPDVEYYLAAPWDKRSFSYTYRSLEKAEKKPVFAPDAHITLEKTENGETLVCFPRATDRFIVHDYGITVKNKGKTLYRKTVLSGYYYLNEPEGYKINVGSLPEADTYRVAVTACNAVYKHTTLRETVCPVRKTGGTGRG